MRSLHTWNVTTKALGWVANSESYSGFVSGSSMPAAVTARVLWSTSTDRRTSCLSTSATTYPAWILNFAAIVAGVAHHCQLRSASPLKWTVSLSTFPCLALSTSSLL